MSYKEWAERNGERIISEREFRAAAEERRRDLAASIAASGLSYTHIANGTRVGRKAVSRAARCVEIRSEAADRIRYYLRAWNADRQARIDAANDEEAERLSIEQSQTK